MQFQSAFLKFLEVLDVELSPRQALLHIFMKLSQLRFHHLTLVDGVDDVFRKVAVGFVGKLRRCHIFQ